MLEPAIDALAVHRLTRLVTADVLTQRARDRAVGALYRRQADRRRRFRRADSSDPYEVPVTGWADYATADPDAPRLATLLTCRWCASVWLAAGVVLARRLAPGPWGYVARALAASSVAGLLVQWEDD